ncbi:FAD-dependent oxidoreductase [Petroclostridium sp. X23]|uniref:oxidoreductase n=1 Tax=Petroclostridium sp. X23 TaxID=3045146 RepID=UPI0024AD75DE|nr:FAD-dependent oxidoreductase [Petroclostridium sp. X23]WHH60912.1 FAD-dependent oxidoreductase [Petroclostridium sp. X23]
MKYKHLFKPIQIGSTIIKNRIAMAPINNSTQMDPITGQTTMTMVEYFAERARGGTGLLVTGVYKVEYEVEQCINKKENLRKWCFFSPQSIRMLGEMVARIHAYDSKIFFQLSAGPGRVTPAETIKSGVQPVSASENRCFFMPNVCCRALTTKEVEQIVEAFGRAAVFAKSIGADGIEIHGHEGYLIDQFTTAVWNRRTDKYGGDLRGRLTFPIEILRAIKEAAGEDFTVTYRMGVKHFVEAPFKGALHTGMNEIGREIEDSVEQAKLLEEAGYDGFSIDMGCYESSYWSHPPYYMPHGYGVDITAAIKTAVKVPVMVAGRLGMPELADQAIAEGKTDMVAIGRDLLADPDWPNKIARDEIEEIRPCLGCHDGCMERTGQGRFLSCSVNPACSREEINKIIPAYRSKKILIAGGGVAGMEFARIAAQRGHDVTIFEKTNELGGHLLEAGVPNFKDDIKRLVAWYRRQISQMDIKVEFGCPVDMDVFKTLNPDAVVVATGSTYRLPKVEGVNKSNVVTCCELLRGGKQVKGCVAIIGGGIEGSETALWLAQQGVKVTIVELQDDIVKTGMIRCNRNMLIDQLNELGVKKMVDQRLYRIIDSGIEVITKKMEINTIKCDTVVMATGVKANNEVYSSFLGTAGELYQIGDCKQPRKIHDAIWEGWYIGLHI